MKKVPFYPNTPDQTHCVQAGIKIVLKYFLPERDFSMEELEKLTSYIKGKGTWNTAAFINLHKMGFDVVDMDVLDIDEFLKRGPDYMLELYGPEIGQWAIEHTDFPKEQALYRELQQLGIHQAVTPTIEDIKRLLDDGYLVGPGVNSRALNDKPGFAGHFVVVFDYDDKGFYLHDPGLPALENRFVDYDKFYKAWSASDDRTKTLAAFRLKSR